MISYKPFWETLKQSDENSYTLIFKHGISSSLLTRMRNGSGISTRKIDDLCQILKCSVSDIIEYIETEKDT